MQRVSRAVKAVPVPTPHVTMYFDLNVPVGPVTEGSKKGKAPAAANDVEWSERDQGALDARLDVLAHRMYPSYCKRLCFPRLTFRLPI